MRKLYIILLLLSFTLLSIFAVDDATKEFDTPLYRELEHGIKSNEDMVTVTSLFNGYMDSSLSTFEKARAENLYLRYLADNGEKEEAEKHLEKEKEYYSAILNEDVPEVLKRIAELDYSSAKTYIDGNLSNGLENSNLTKKAVKDYPEEAFFIITDGWRLIYTPQIAGGSNKNAIKELEPLLESLEELSLSNVYSLYGALAMAHYNRKDYDKGREYLDRAFAIYYGEPALLELDENLRKKMK